MVRRRSSAKPYKRGTPMQDRVAPKLAQLGYDISTLRLVRFGRGGGTYELVLNDRIIGEYDGLHDRLYVYSEPTEQEDAPE